MSQDAKGSPPRILVIDDTPSIHEDFRRILAPEAPPEDDLDALASLFFGDEAPPKPKARGTFGVDFAFQGEQGFGFVETALAVGRPYSLMFVDMRMPPGWDGLETIEAIWAIDPAVQTVICTAYSDHSWDEIVARLGHSDRLLIVRKPFDSLEILQLAHALSRKWSLQREVDQRLADLDALVQREMARREEAERELRLAQKLEAIGQLAAGVAHEINTPIQYIGDNVEFLDMAFGGLLELVAAAEPAIASWRETAPGDPRLAALDRVRQRARVDFVAAEVPLAIAQSREGIGRVSTIVGALKEFSHPGGKDTAPVQLNQAIQITVEVSRNEWKYVAALDTDLAPDLPAVPGFAGELNQVLLNLIVNAAHAVGDSLGPEPEARGRIRVTTRAQQAEVVLEVHDSGPGVPPELRDRLFDPFFTTKEVGKGSGQGLAIARHIVVDKHGGAIEVGTSDLGGAVFTVRLPLVGSAPRRPTSRRAARPSPVAAPTPL